MKRTNYLNLPQPLVDAVSNDSYSKGNSDYSVTELLRPPRIAQLERQHWDEIEEDVSDRIWSLCGQVIHGILERGEKEGTAEKRLYLTIDGKIISGQMDRIITQDNKLQDYKFVSLWKVKNGCPLEYEQQVNCYVYILRQHCYKIDTAEIVAMLRDWKLPEARRSESYPQQQVKIVKVPIWDDADTLKFIRARIAEHEEAKGVLPTCTDHDRWATPDMWAVIKPGGKRAVRVYPTKEEAQEHVKAFEADGYVIDHRPGDRTKRCVDYCRVANFCAQYEFLRTMK